MRLMLAVVLAAAAGLVGCAKEERHAAGVASALHLPRRVLSRASRGEHRSPLPRTVPRGLRTHPRVLGGGATLSTTAYCATGSRTASGVWPQIGMAAGNRWPFGTRLHVDGYGTVTITDRIGWGSDLDIYFGGGADCEARANAYGRQSRRVDVVT